MAQAGLTALDTWMARNWRERERSWREDIQQWRAEDLIFRKEQCQFNIAECKFRQLRHRWRAEDMKQRQVDNSRYLWARSNLPLRIRPQIRCAELNRRDVDEKAEHLRLLSWLTGLITSFTMTSPIEFNYGISEVSTARLAAYAVCTALVPTLMSTSTMICVFLLGNILKVGKLFVAEHGEEDFMTRCRIYAAFVNPLHHAPPAPRRTFERFWEFRCEDEWNRAFRLFSWGITVFMALLCTMSFIKFQFEDLIAIFFSIVIGLFFFIWLGIIFTWGSYLQEEVEDVPSVAVSRRDRGLSRRDDPFKWHLCPIKDTSETSSMSLLYRDLPSSTPSLPQTESFEPSGRSSVSIDVVPLETQIEIS